MINIPVTIIIPVKNEEVNLPNCLAPLGNFNQIIVIDSSSTDQTKKIATQFNVEFYNFNWDGKFPKKRNWAIHNLSITNDWVFFLDADEYLTPEFIAELSDKIKNKSINGYWVKYQNYFMGKKLKYGDTMKKLPLFRLGKGEYEKIEEDSWSHLDMEVHEHPIIEGKISQIKSPVIHNDFKGLEHYIARHNAYSSWEANRYYHLRKSGFTNLNYRQKIKYKIIGTGLLPLIYFWGSYIFKLGFLDGREGYYFAKYKANYFFQIQTKIREHRKSQ
jgi:glycosyltransferase involved in cell wall biosynthesis